jgi:hypothetical protein
MTMEQVLKSKTALSKAWRGVRTERTNWPVGERERAVELAMVESLNNKRMQAAAFLDLTHLIQHPLARERERERT